MAEDNIITDQVQGQVTAPDPNDPNNPDNPNNPLNPLNPNSLLNPSNPKSLLNSSNPASPFYKGGRNEPDEKEVGNRLAKAIKKASREEVEAMVQMATPAELYAAADAAGAAGDTALASELQSDADERRMEDTPRPTADPNKNNNQQSSADDGPDRDDAANANAASALGDSAPADDNFSTNGPSDPVETMAELAGAAAMLTGAAAGLGGPAGFGASAFLPPGVPGSPIPGAATTLANAATTGSMLASGPTAATTSMFLSGNTAGQATNNANYPSSTTTPKTGTTTKTSTPSTSTASKPVLTSFMSAPTAPSPPKARPRASYKNDE